MSTVVTETGGYLWNCKRMGHKSCVEAGFLYGSPIGLTAMLSQPCCRRYIENILIIYYLIIRLITLLLNNLIVFL